MKKFLALFNNYDIMLLIICTAVVFLANLIALEGFYLHKIVSNRYLVVLILYVFIMIMFKKQKIKNLEKNIQKSTILFLIIWGGLFVSIFISKIINKGSNIIDVLLMLSIVPFFFFIKNSYNIEKHLNLACIINLIPLLFILKGGNALSLLITIIGITVINITIRKIAEKGYIFSYIIIVAFFLLLIIVTKCRTCIISFLLISGINYIYLLTQNKFYIKKIIASILILVCLIVTGNTMKNILFNKYGSSYVDITTGRAKIWENVIKDDIKLFGNEDNYFMKTTNKGDAHNVYTQILGHYGIIPLFLYLIYGLTDIVLESPVIVSRYVLNSLWINI